MSDFFDDEYDDEPTQQVAPTDGGPKALRDAYEREKEARKALEDRLATIERESREAKLASALKETGVNPKVAKLIPSDVAPDKVGDWISEYGDLFGVKQEETPQGVSPEQAAQIAAVSGDSGGSTTATPTTLDAAAISAIDNEADFAKAMGWA